MKHTHDTPGNSRWLEVSLELDHRAKIYNLKDKKPGSEVKKQERNIQGIIPCQYHSDRFNHENLSSASWDWVFGPLIQQIFDLELATWVCLGHFEGGSSRWLYYFSRELSPPLPQKLDPQKMEGEEMRAFLRAYRCFSYNAWRKFTNPPILLTSILMQKIMSANIDKEEFPQGASLFLSFASDSLKSTKVPFYIPYLWNINLSKEAKKAQIGKKDREKILEKICPDDYISGMVNKFLSSGVQNNIISFWRNENNSGSIPTNILEAVAEYNKALNNIFDDNAKLTKEKFSEELWKYYAEYRDADKNADAQLARFVVWMHDSIEVLNGILSIPAWFPPGSGSRESASLIVGFKRPVSIDELRAIISAFRLGSSSISIRSERKQSFDIGLEGAINAFSHEVGKIGSKLLSEFVYDLDEIFDLGKSKLDEKSGLYKFKKMCTLDMPEELKDKLNGWQIFPMKDVTDSLSFLLQVWGGTKNVINSLKIDIKDESITIRDLIKNLSDKIKGIAVARKFIIPLARPLSLEDIDNFLQEYKIGFETTASLASPEGEGADLRILLGENQRGPVSVFIRLLAALLSNSIYHAVDNTEVKVRLNYRNSDEKLEIKIINESDINQSSDEPNYFSDFSIGSKGVALICLDKLQGRILQFPNSSDKKGVTSFEVPVKIELKGGFLKWIQEK